MKLLFENWRQYTNLLNEEQLLIESRVKDAKKKYPELDREGLLGILIDNDPSGNHKYLAWAAGQLDYVHTNVGALPGRIKQVAERLATDLDLYHKLHVYVTGTDEPYRDISKIKDLTTLHHVAQNAKRKKDLKDRQKEQDRQLRRHAMENSDLGVYQDDDFMMHRPFDSTASCYWGKAGNPWCIAQAGGEMFDSFTSENKSFFYLEMKNKKNFLPEDWNRLYSGRLVLQFQDENYDTAFDRENEGSGIDEHEVIELIAINILGNDFVKAYENAEHYGYVLDDPHEEDDFKKEQPGSYETIVSTLKEYGMDPGYDLEDFYNDAVLQTWYDIQYSGTGSVERRPPGPQPEDYEKIRDDADLQYATIGDIDFYEGNAHYSAYLSFDFDDYEFGQPASPDTLDEFDIEKEIKEVLHDHDINVDDLDISSENRIYTTIFPGEDYYTRDPLQRFENFVNEMSEIDEKYEETKESLVDLFIDEGILDISDEPIGNLKAKLAEKELKNFDITGTGRTLESNSNIFEYPEVGIREGAKDIMELMGHWELAEPARRRGATNLAAGRITGYWNNIAAKIVYFFKQSFESADGRSYADDVLFDKMDTLLAQAYADAEKQLSIPGIEAPERKRVIPPLAVGLSPSVYASQDEDKVKIRLYIKADAKLGEEQAGFIAEFIDFFDENFDSLHTIVGEVVGKLLKEAVVKALEAVKEEMPDRARALGVDESKKRKKGIKILLGNRR